MNDNFNEFYDVKISRDIINEKERNNITDSLVKNDSKHWYNNKCFFVSALIVIIAVGIYVLFIFL
jgi:hypothetical protein